MTAKTLIAGLVAAAIGAGSALGASGCGEKRSSGTGTGGGSGTGAGSTGGTGAQTAPTDTTETTN